MTKPSRFSAPWEPKLLDRQILAKGNWWYAGTVRHEVQLFMELYDYTSGDLDEIEMNAGTIVWQNYVHLEINGRGEIFYWQFSDPNGTSESPIFGNLEEAKSHFASYGKSEVTWEDNVECSGDSVPGTPYLIQPR